MTNEIFDAFGYVLKEEGLEKLSSKIIPGTLVVQDIHPFPGYHGSNLPERSTKPGHIYFLTKKKYNWEDITSISHKVKKYIGFSFLYYDASIKANTKEFGAIRIKNLESYEQVEELQRAFQAEGISFEKDKKFPEIGLTKLKKFFVLKRLEEGFFHEQEELNLYYIVMPRILSWEFFRKIITLTRSNLPDINYDAAQAVIYYRNEMYNTFRIYGKSIDLSKLKQLKDKYLELIKRYE